MGSIVWLLRCDGLVLFYVPKRVRVFMSSRSVVVSVKSASKDAIVNAVVCFFFFWAPWLRVGMWHRHLRERSFRTCSDKHLGSDHRWNALVVFLVLQGFWLYLLVMLAVRCCCVFERLTNLFAEALAVCRKPNRWTHTFSECTCSTNTCQRDAREPTMQASASVAPAAVTSGALHAPQNANHHGPCVRGHVLHQSCTCQVPFCRRVVNRGEMCQLRQGTDRTPPRSNLFLVASVLRTQWTSIPVCAPCLQPVPCRTGWHPSWHVGKSALCT